MARTGTRSASSRPVQGPRPGPDYAPPHQHRPNRHRDRQHPPDPGLRALGRQPHHAARRVDLAPPQLENLSLPPGSSSMQSPTRLGRVAASACGPPDTLRVRRSPTWNHFLRAAQETPAAGRAARPAPRAAACGKALRSPGSPLPPRLRRPGGYADTSESLPS